MQQSKISNSKAPLESEVPIRNTTSWPSCLRKAMIEKFPDFSEYQLGKLCKIKNIISLIIFKTI